MRLNGKVAMVTGSGQGLGRAIALRLAQEGARIVVEDRQDNDKAEETLAMVRKAGVEACVVAGDIADPAIDRRVVAEAVEKMGQLDILVNNAGVERRADFWDVTEADYDLVLGVNLRGLFFTTQAFVNHLRERKQGGRIINISSVHEELPFPHFSTYGASKGGVKMLMRDLAIELAPMGITVNNVAPGAIETPINAKLMDNKAEMDALLKNIPLRRMGTPEDVAGSVAFLASPDADYITGTTVYVDGGLLWNYSEQ